MLNTCCFYKVMYDTRHCVERKGAKEQHLHLHMVFHLLFSDKKSHVDKLKRFIRAFLLGILRIKKKNLVPKHITSSFSYYPKEEIKDIMSGHWIKLYLIHKPTETFSHCECLYVQLWQTLLN